MLTFSPKPNLQPLPTNITQKKFHHLCFTAFAHCTHQMYSTCLHQSYLHSRRCEVRRNVKESNMADMHCKTRSEIKSQAKKRLLYATDDISHRL